MRRRAQDGVLRTRATTSGMWVLLIGGTYALLLVAGLGVGFGADVPRAWFGIAGVFPISFFAAFLGVLAVREPRLDRRARAAWALIAAAHVALGAGIALGAYRPPLGPEPPGYLAGALFLLFYPLLLAGLLAFPLESSSPRRRRVFWLDTVTSLLAGAIVFWYVVPPLAGAEGATTFGRFLQVAAAVGDFLLLFGVAAVLFRRASAQIAFGLRLLVIAVVAIWVAQIGTALSQGRIEIAGESWFLALRIGQGLLVAAAAHSMVIGARFRRPASSSSWAKGDRSRRFAIPPASFSYFGISLGYGILLYAASGAAPHELKALVAVGGALVALLVVRQSIVIRDTERARATIKASEERFRALVQHASDVVTVIDVDGVVSYQGPSAERVLGRSPLVPGTPLEDELHPEDRHVLYATLQQALRSRGTPVRGEWRVRHANGVWLHLETVATNLIGDGVIDGIVLNSSDLTERKALEEELIHRAFHDPLTGLANRALFSNILDLALIRARRSGKGTAILFLDLDNFKLVNDVLGHGAGDAVLTEVAERLRREVRISDTVARFGGDEFAVLLDDMSQPGDALPVTKRLLEALRIDVPDGRGGVIPVSASVGLVVATGLESREEMLRQADVAMYAAKRGGGNRFFQSAELRGNVAQGESLEEADLRRALELGEFAIRYQPIRTVTDGRIRAVAGEARWFHPRLGLLPPEEFDELAERTGLDRQLGYHILEEACRQVAVWQRRYPSESPIALGVGVTLRQLQDPAFAEHVRGIVARAGLAAGTLVLEIGEEDLFRGGSELAHRLQPIREQGVRLAVTQFGAGCRVLNALEAAPIDQLRMDSSLVADLGNGGRLGAAAVLGIGRSLNVQTLADGVADARQLELLRELGCELVQGDHAGPPVSRDQLEELLRSAGPRPLAANP